MIRTRAPGTRAPPPPPLLLSLSLLLLLLSPTVSGDCGPPPDIPNATPNSGKHTKFAHQSQVTYSCNKGFKQIPDKPNTVVCLENDQWSNYETFCNKTCSAPLRLNYASLKKEYRNMNFFPIGTTVEFECRPGFQKVTSRTGKSTCLEELVWSPVVEFCKKRACPNPRELKNGHINIPTDILFGSEIIFSCDKGYKLVGVTSTFCSITGNAVDWDDVFPVCTTIFCPDPPKINNGRIREESDSYAYRQSVTYSCDQGFILVGNSSVHCTLNGEVGEWSSAPPKCIERHKVPTKTPPEVDIPSTMPHESTLINFPSTRAPLSHKPTTVKVPATQHVPVSKTTVRHPTRTSKDRGESNSGGDHFIYGFVAVIVTIDSIILIKTLWWTILSSNRSSDLQGKKKRENVPE
ncbi:complement decay-accelerating factor isoform X6 [Rattus norvegicus]|uniref:complement decay-accelerating factor isoform X6 n=1 Tax=Rattus norvegicus TaxID=10116 RepID=UPI001917671B|nr:complement decay-accelerating factor isoform X3 [Rattus norvegicus]